MTPVPVPRCTQGTPQRTRTTKSGLRGGICGFNSESVSGAKLARHDQARHIRSVGGIALACKPAPKGVRVYGLCACGWEMEACMYMTASPLKGSQALYVQYAMGSLADSMRHPLWALRRIAVRHPV